MENLHRFDAGRAWPLLCTAWLIAYLMGEIYEDYMIDVAVIVSLLKVGIFLLSFPCNLLLLLTVGSVECYECDYLSEPLFWTGMLATAYFQWSWLVPRFISGKMTTLGLTTTGRDGSAFDKSFSQSSSPPADQPTDSGEPPALSPAPTVSAATLATAARVSPVMPQFDEAGRTPLERMLGDISAR